MPVPAAEQHFVELRFDNEQGHRIGAVVGWQSTEAADWTQFLQPGRFGASLQPPRVLLLAQSRIQYPGNFRRAIAGAEVRARMGRQ
jgi:hypothetical protein